MKKFFIKKLFYLMLLVLLGACAHSDLIHENMKSSAPEGFVKLSYQISEQGRAVNIKVLESEPKGHFDRSAIEAVSRWRWKISQNKKERADFYHPQEVTLNYNLQ